MYITRLYILRRSIGVAVTGCTITAHSRPLPTGCEARHGYPTVQLFYFASVTDKPDVAPHVPHDSEPTSLTT